MDKKYTNLQALLRDDVEARRYFSALPDYVQEQITARSEGVNSFASLEDYAQNLTRGDR
ncbi:MAG: hypothetical protein VB099_01545 [Candidatus Limiplasma sp.]|nr:hypothetical protein [Candidatus Limiplasma sp.]